MHPAPNRFMPSLSQQATRPTTLRLRPIAVIATLASAIILAGCQAVQPAALETIGETVLQLGDAVSALQMENAMLQEQVDSLRGAVARQDTALRRFANLAGMPLP